MKYTTNKGDTFDSIAYEVYGDEEMMTLLMDANPQYIETAVFGCGIPLEVPIVEKMTVSSMLPPWRVA